MKRYAIEIIEHANAPTNYVAMKKGWLWGWNDINGRGIFANEPSIRT